MYPYSEWTIIANGPPLCDPTNFILVNITTLHNNN